MKIAIDLRSLQSGSISGVENYILNLLEHMVPADPNNTYTLFTNSYRTYDFNHLKFINTTSVSTRIPNRLLNASLKLFNYPKFEDLFGDFDCLFMPNFNQFAIKPKTKLVVTVHDLSPIVAPEFYDLKRRLWHQFVGIKKSLLRADQILAVSDFTKRELIRIYNLPENKITVTPLGVNRTLFQPNISVSKLRAARNIYGVPGDYFIFIATLEPRKNIAGIITAFEQYKGPESLVLAGKQGWKYNAIMDQIAASPKRRQIKYLGYIDEDYKPAVLKLAKALIWPSFYEGFGLPPLEAMSVGTPVITSQASSLPETVGNAALMVDPYSTRDITKAMEIMSRDETARQTFITAGFEQVKKFDWATTAEKTLGAINAIR